MLSSRLKAFVIPISQNTASAVAAMSFEMIWTWMPDAITSAAAASLRSELRERRKREHVVDEPGHEEDRAAADDAAERSARRDDAPCDGDADGEEEAGEDPAAAEERRRAGVPAVGPRGRDHVPCGRRAAQGPDRQQARWKRSECGRDDRHGINLIKGC